MNEFSFAFRAGKQSCRVVARHMLAIRLLIEKTVSTYFALERLLFRMDANVSFVQGRCRELLATRVTIQNRLLLFRFFSFGMHLHVFDDFISITESRIAVRTSETILGFTFDAGPNGTLLRMHFHFRFAVKSLFAFATTVWFVQRMDALHMCFQRLEIVECSLANLAHEHPFGRMHFHVTRVVRFLRKTLRTQCAL